MVPPRGGCVIVSRPKIFKALIYLYRSGATARQVAKNYCDSLRSVKRLLHQYDIRHERAI